MVSYSNKAKPLSFSTSFLPVRACEHQAHSFGLVIIICDEFELVGYYFFQWIAHESYSHKMKNERNLEHLFFSHKIAKDHSNIYIDRYLKCFYFLAFLAEDLHGQ